MDYTKPTEKPVEIKQFRKSVKSREGKTRIRKQHKRKNSLRMRQTAVLVTQQQLST